MAPIKIISSNSDDPKLRIIKEMLLGYYNSTCAIVDERYHVRYTYGEIDLYLRLVAGGDMQQSILVMAREGLDAELTIALYNAFDNDEIIIRQGVWVNTMRGERFINLIVKPIQDNALDSRHRLIIFEYVTGNGNQRIDPTEPVTHEEGVTITRLREELQQARQVVQSATQALQAKSEELTSSMEEISSANEEVQTTNEELRTSKEELESMNEELNTLNTQLSHQNYELTHANNALYNFLQSTQIGVIFLDQKLAIREYTQAVTTIFSLRKSDIGRPLSEIKTQLGYEHLIDDAVTVLDTLVNTEIESVTTTGEWYKVEIRPYRTMNNVIDGLVLGFTDITIQKLAQQEAEKLALYSRSVVDTVNNGLLELDGAMRVLAANTAFYETFRGEPSATIGRLLYELDDGQWDIPDLRHLLTQIIPEQTFVRDYVITVDFAIIGRRTLRLNARQIKELDRILLVIADVSEAPAS